MHQQHHVKPYYKVMHGPEHIEPLAPTKIWQRKCDHDAEDYLQYDARHSRAEEKAVLIFAAPETSIERPAFPQDKIQNVKQRMRQTQNKGYRAEHQMSIISLFKWDVVREPGALHQREDGAKHGNKHQDTVEIQEHTKYSRHID